ncbi:hypothetical protein MZ16F87_39730 [Escherichia coli]
MAVFSNLEGTMKKTFILGKNGAQIATNGNVVQIQNYTGTQLLPVSAGDPTANTHLVTLGYLNTHSGGGGGSGILRGTIAPSESNGVDGDAYFLVNSTNIIQIYIKDLGVWKPLQSTTPGTDSSYVTTEIVPVSAFTLVPGTTDQYTYSLPESVHGRGPDIMVQLQGDPGNIPLDTVFQTNVTVSGIGDITIDVIGQITEYTSVKVNIIGATTMTVPYSKLINIADWVASGDDYTITVPASEHNQTPDNLYISIYSNKTPGSTAASPFELVITETQIDASGNVTFTSDEAFSGKIVISGK